MFFAKLLAVRRTVVQWPKLRIGTRPSRLALVQVDLLKLALCQRFPDLYGNIETIIFETPGDINRSSSLEDLGGRGVFTDNLDDAVLHGRVDCVVHAMKDMAPELPGALILGATLKREDPREVLVSPWHKTLDDIPEGGVFGSSSIRRRALLRRLRPDLRFDLLRGNVEERIAQVDSRQLDGTILAYAGLARLNLTHHVRQIFPLDVLPPDPCQGAIGIVCHAQNFVARRLLQEISHQPTFAEVTAERALLTFLPQPDALAIGAIARVEGAQLSMSALLVSEDGAEEWIDQVDGPAGDANILGKRLAARLHKPALRLISA